MRILTIVGARPQFVKAAVVSRALKEHPSVAEDILHTGQHYDPMMSDVFFEELGIPRPTYHLEIGSLSHGAQTGRMLEEIEKVLMGTRYDMVLIYGDTNSTLAGALAAVKLHIPVAHVEAGLRSFNRRMPEEINRIVSDSVASILFAPTDLAVENLRREGVPSEKIHQVGDVMYDAAKLFAALPSREDLQVPSEFILATIHRAENTDDPGRLKAIAEALAQVAERMPILLPLHPRTVGKLREAGLENALGNVRVMEPLGYSDMLKLEKAASLIVTDSGGVQKEAFFQRVPCVTLRDETEWVELVETGWNRLCPPIEATRIADTILASIGSRGDDVALYGGGEASKRIALILAALA